jgi:hypothetical protein
MKPYGLNCKPIRSKSKNELKAKWSRLLLHNFKRTFKKGYRRRIKNEITKEINENRK